ncbi:hypothetical protein FB451DRAFT_1527885 [Mycena latifolia]|nr:hypothetical protein FB451DRAFT_1527885 [Mycena latifolia]
MRFFPSVVALTALLVSVAATPAPGSLAKRAPGDVVPRALTNAVRMAAGYGPEMPRSILKARGNYKPRASRTRNNPGPAVASPVIPNTVCGHLRIDQVGGGTLGYVSKNANGYGEFTLVNEKSSGVTATIPNPVLGHTSNIDIRAPTDNADIWPYFGAFISPWAASYGSNYGTDSYAHSILGPTIQAAAGPSSAYNGGTAFQHFYGSSYGFSEAKLETAIWTLNPVTHQLTASWINDAPGAASVPARVLWSASQRNILIGAKQTTGDFNSQFGIDYVDAELYFVSNEL